jgi:hypothetical protein
MEGQNMKKKIEQNAVTVVIETPGGLNSQTGKAEEIAVLSLITDRVRGTQTYLDSLFTDGFFDYVAGKIKDDFAPDLYMEYMAEIENNRNLSADLSKARTSIDLLNKDKDDLKILAKCEIGRRDKEIENKINYIKELGVALGDARRDYITTKNERDSLADQVTALKVKLYDIQNATA